MTTLFIVLIVIVAVLLVISVLVQNPKGGGVSSGWGINTNQFGVRNTTDFLEKTTWVLVGLLLVLSISINSIYTGYKDVDSDTPSSINVEKAQEGSAQLPSSAAPAETSEEPAPAASDSGK